MTFYLGETPSHNGNDVAIGSTTAASGTVGVAGSVPQEVAPGFYYLQACIGSNCVASLGTIQIIGQALSAVDQSTDTSVLADPPGPGVFPRNDSRHGGGQSVSLSDLIARPVSEQLRLGHDSTPKAASEEQLGLVVLPSGQSLSLRGSARI